MVDYKTTKEVPGPWNVYTCPSCGKVMQAGRWKLRRGCRKTCRHCGTRHEPAAVKAALTKEPPRPYSGHTVQLSVYRWLLASNGIEVDTGEIVYLDMEQVKRLPVDLWDLDRTESWIGKRLRALTGSSLPRVLATGDDASWQCRFCPVVELCRRMADS